MFLLTQKKFAVHKIMSFVNNTHSDSAIYTLEIKRWPFVILKISMLYFLITRCK